MKNLKNSILFKLFTIFVLMVLLLIPTALIKGLIGDRENTQNEAIREVS